MIHNQRKADKIDKVCLIAALMVANEMEEDLPEGEISRASVDDLDGLFTVAKTALKFIAKMHRQDPKDWDGVVWYEQFCAASQGSLADCLVSVVVREEHDDPDAVRAAVIEWLIASDL